LPVALVVVGESESMITTQVKERPLLFKGEMVRAILEGRKTQTRRICKSEFGAEVCQYSASGWAHKSKDGGCTCCEIKGFWWGDALWVKETFLYRAQRRGVVYRADLDSVEAAGVGALYGGWKPSIFMPRALSRITLEIVSVSVERLGDISEEDAKAEGVTLRHKPDDYAKGEAHRFEFRELWDSINGKYPSSFLKSPWVWRIEFRRVKP
jgi:hypothetical protein